MKNKLETSQKNICIEISKGNFEQFKIHFSENVFWDILGNGSIVGKEEVLTVLKMSQLESFPLITIKSVIEEGNIVVIESTGVATTKKGNPYNQTYCDIYHFKDEKIIKFTTYLDTALSNEVDK